MKISEQLRRIIKAAPHFPVQTYTGVGLLIALPFCLVQLYAAAPFNWIKTEAVIKDSEPVQERFRDKEVEYYYTLDYSFKVGGQQYSIFFDKAFTDQRQAREELQTTLSKAEKVFVWYKRTNPSIASFQDTSSQCQLYLVIVITMVILLAYFRWMMLKYYELEIR
jgi:hypothetical protein